MLVTFRGLNTPSGRVAAGLVLGVAVGLFFGESIAFLSLAADAYVQLLRVTVIPYVTVALIVGIGSLTRPLAVLMVTRVGAVLLALWAATLALVFVMPLAFPRWETASFFSSALLAEPEPFDLVRAYIPSNPFNSLANGIVPAVVIFSILLGASLIGAADRDRFLGWLAVVRTALGDMTTAFVRLAPLGLFAIAATLAGTLRPEELERVQVYLIAYGMFALLLALWIIPGLVCALTPVPYRDVFGLLRDALVMAVLTGELFVVLPTLAEASRELVRRHAPAGTNAVALTDIIVPASFNFPHAGKILSLSFVLFAGWFSEMPVSFADAPMLAVSGILTSFASLTAAIPYLLDLLRIPADTFQLFLATGLINSRIGTAVAAVHTVGLATLGAFATVGALAPTARRLLRYGAISALLTVAVVSGLRGLFERVLPHHYTKDTLVAGMRLMREEAVVVRGEAGAEPDEAAGVSTLARIRARGHLRVGYLPDSLPYAFVNRSGELVGFDVEMAHRLAHELGVGVRFVPSDGTDLAGELARGTHDIVMSGLVLTTRRAEHVGFTIPYLDEHIAFVVEDHRRAQFTTLAEIRGLRNLRIATLDVPYYIEKLRTLLPNATVVVLRSREDVETYFRSGPGDLDALALTAERGSAWTLLYPRFSVSVPRPQLLTIPLAYPVSNRDETFVTFLDRWLELKKRDGTVVELYDYWILGKNPQQQQPRWSIARNVLGWLD
jgi:Na+/H+-dicarboxylate symporter/ABC-type amino acid transport substrate-binding protein